MKKKAIVDKSTETQDNNSIDRKIITLYNLSK